MRCLQRTKCHYGGPWKTKMLSSMSLYSSKTQAQDACSEESNTQERHETNITILSLESCGFRTDNAVALEKIEEGYSKWKSDVVCLKNDFSRTH